MNSQSDIFLFNNWLHLVANIKNKRSNVRVEEEDISKLAPLTCLSGCKPTNLKWCKNKFSEMDKIVA